MQHQSRDTCIYIHTFGRFTKPKSCGKQAVLVTLSVATTDSWTVLEPKLTSKEEKTSSDGVTTACTVKSNGRTYTSNRYKQFNDGRFIQISYQISNGYFYRYLHLSFPTAPGSGAILLAICHNALLWVKFQLSSKTAVGLYHTMPG